MSRFEPITLACPSPTCGAPVQFAACSSVNADRRPDIREGVLDGSFQREPCRVCGTAFRLDPEFSYVDLARGAWTSVRPAGNLPEWKEHEEAALSAFKLAYGPKASAAARDIGKDLKPRLVFGWPALREKLVAADAKLDDIELELTKMAIVRGNGGMSPAGGVELRLTEVDGDKLVMAWVRAQGEEVEELLRAPRGLYDEVAADTSGWKDLRKELTGVLFVDTQRLLVG